MTDRPYGEEQLRLAEEALDLELRAVGATIRRVVRLDDVLRSARRPNGTYSWRMIAAWLRANPLTVFHVTPVPSNAVSRMKARYPYLTVIGFDHHFVSEGTRVAQMFAVYVPEEDN